MVGQNKKTALISVFNKDGIVEFASALIALGWQIISSGGTAKVLQTAGLAVTDVAELVGGGAILGHRVVTLSREVHAGLLARPDNPDDLAEMKKLGLLFIDLVCCDFYPIRNEISKPEATVESVVNMTDIGGPTMVSAGAKGGRIVICDPDDRMWVLAELQTNGDVSKEDRQSLRAKAEAEVVKYRFVSASFHSDMAFDGLLGWLDKELAYAENRDQNPAFLYSTGSDDPLGWDKFQVLAGDPSYISIADGDRALGVLSLIWETLKANEQHLVFKASQLFIAIACKHGNPCGAAISHVSPNEAILKAMLGDPLAVMGAEVMTNFPITGELATAIHRVPEILRARVGREFWGTDVVYAPSFDQEAIDLLSKKEKRRLMANPALANPEFPPDDWMIRPVRGGFLRQKIQKDVFDLWPSLGAIGRDVASILNFILVHAVVWRSVSNTVGLVKDQMLIGLGCGQQDRIACVKLCLERAERSGHDTTGSWFGSDAFFPYAQRKSVEAPLEGPELLVNAGCVGGVVPRDGKNAEEVIAFFLGTRSPRHILQCHSPRFLWSLICSNRLVPVHYVKASTSVGAFLLPAFTLG